MNMNNNDILNELHNNCENCNPSDRLNPMTIEQSLYGVKRKSNKGIISACVTIGVICFTLAGVFSTMMLAEMTKPTLPIKTEVQTGSYDDIYKIVTSVKEANEETVFDMVEDSVNNALNGGIAYDSVAESTDSNTAGTSSDYSDTNVQVEGVDEADIVKTDGKYIYSVGNNEIWITDPNNGEPKLVSSIAFDSEVSNIYIYENKLVVLTNTYTTDYSMYEEDEDIMYEYSPNRTFTNVLIYDLSDINSPVQISSLSQSGNCLSSRRIDNVVYLTTKYTLYDFENIEKDDPQTFCPVYGVDDDFNCIDSNCIVISENVESINYVTVSSIDLNNSTDFADISSVLGAGSEVYASHNNLYVSAYCYDEDKTQTQIMRFSLDGTDIEPNGSIKVDGSILNQFAMDEYNDYFRIVTETTEYSNYVTDIYTDIAPISSNTRTALYIFDNDLNLTGKTEDVAKGEYVKSVRFDGDIAYFVTFRQTDPLFTVDLSDPSSPQILSELKIPGFSEYLHIFGDDLLLGFGREADIVSGGTEGLKLTMFDVSDKTNVTEIATRIFTGSDSYSNAEYNHKAIFVDEENSIIGIPYQTYLEVGTAYYYAVYEYDKENKDFVLRKNIQLDGYSDEYMRGLYIDDYFYIVTSRRIYAYDYNTFEETSALVETPKTYIN